VIFDVYFRSDMSELKAFFFYEIFCVTSIFAYIALLRVRLICVSAIFASQLVTVIRIACRY
jgi:hypothetical protein